MRRRLAVALVLPEPVATEVNGLRRAAGDRRLDRIAAHVTLVPPVNVAEADLPAALSVVRGAAAACRGPLSFTVGPLATFLPATPVAYLAVEPVAPIDALRRAANRAPIERRDRRTFVPHVTVTSDQPPLRLAALVTAMADYRREVRCTHLDLLEHRAVDGGPARWETLADARLGPATTLGRGGLEVTVSESRHLDPEAGAFVEHGAVFAARLEDRVVAVAADEAWILDLLARRGLGPAPAQE